MLNSHERIVSAPLEQVAQLLDGLGTDGDRLWPGDRWPPLVLDRGTETGSAGGHDRVRYSVEEAQRSGPARWVAFRFAPQLDLVGTHRFDVEDLGDGRVRLRHVIDAQPVRWMRIGWPLVVRWLHDALIEDAFDGAEAVLAGDPVRRRRLSPWVRALRGTARAAEARPEPEAALRPRRAAADATTAALVGIGALHAVWALGVPWPARDERSLAQAVVGTSTFPSPTATWSVAGLLGAAAVVVQSRVRPGRRVAVVPFPLADLGVRTVAGVLALRGGAGLVVSASRVGNATAVFRALDLALYSPLCLALAWGTRRTWAGGDATRPGRSGRRGAGARPAPRTEWARPETGTGPVPITPLSALLGPGVDPAR